MDAIQCVGVSWQVIAELFCFHINRVGACWTVNWFCIIARPLLRRAKILEKCWDHTRREHFFIRVMTASISWSLEFLKSFNSAPIPIPESLAISISAYQYNEASCECVWISACKLCRCAMWPISCNITASISYWFSHKFTNASVRTISPAGRAAAFAISGFQRRKWSFQGIFSFSRWTRCEWKCSRIFCCFSAGSSLSSST